MIDAFVDLLIGSLITVMLIMMYLAGLMTTALLIARKKFSFSPEWMILLNEEERDAVKGLLESMREEKKK